MLRSMYSGVSGLQNHQTKMDVIGNNIANVNTSGFKSSRVIFKDIYSQTIKKGTASVTGGIGGTNPQQIGMGVAIAAIDVLHTQTAVQYTGNPLDVSIDGDGLFGVTDGINTYFTRAGNFYTDDQNNLVTADGYLLLSEDGATPINISGDYYDININRNGQVVGIDRTTGSETVIATIGIATFNNQNALEKIGGNLYASNANTGTPTFNAPGNNGTAFLNAGSLEMSNVDMAKEFTDMITTQRGFQANSRVITTSDQMLEELVNLKR